MSKEFEPPVKAVEFKAEEMAFYKVVAEASCLAYQLTKIPIIRKSVDFLELNGGLERIDFGTLLTETLLNGTNYLLLETPKLAEVDWLSWQKACDIRSELFCYALEERWRRKGSLVGAWQSEEWVWRKVKGEEIWELVEEAEKFQQVLEAEKQPLALTLLSRIERLRGLAQSELGDIEEWLLEIFDLIGYLGVENKLNLFLFMKEKQEGRIALGENHLTKNDKEKEWERLGPILRKYFKNH